MKVSVSFLLAMTVTALGGPESDHGEVPVVRQYGPDHWVRREAGLSCSSYAERSATGCTVSRCEEIGGGFADGKIRIACNETAEVCGHAYHCECQTCSDAPDYATRMTRKRRAVYTPPHEDGIVLFTVSYEDGKCEGVADPHYGHEKLCMVSAWDNSHVGGCYRPTGDPATGTFDCDESRTVCGGVQLRCDCFDGGFKQLRILGAGVERPEPCVENWQPQQETTQSP
jgi:hypothetical protein